MDKYLELSSKYDTFIYDSYKVYKEDNKLKVDYHYIIKDLEDFNTTLSIDESEINSAFAEIGGTVPEFSNGEDIDKIEHSMNAAGYSCFKEK